VQKDIFLNAVKNWVHWGELYIGMGQISIRHKTGWISTVSTHTGMVALHSRRNTTNHLHCTHMTTGVATSD